MCLVLSGCFCLMEEGSNNRPLLQDFMSDLRFSLSCEVTSDETDSYMINVIGLLGKRFIFKADMGQFRMFIKCHFLLEGDIVKGNDDLKKIL